VSAPEAAEAHEIAARLAGVRAQISRAAEAAQRDPAQVRLVAVSKLKPASAVAAALAAGQERFGENYAQELQEKYDTFAALPAPRPEWHFLGALQSNKAKVVVGRAALVHTCDRASLARELSKQAQKRGGGFVQTVLLEVNLALEPQKGGCAPAELQALLREVAALPGLRCDGLMAIPPAEGDPRPHFRALRRLRDEALSAGVVESLPELSMGMSADFEAAIAEGATLVRVGTAIFGARA
jgi:pyridoxal phosphate enzyme (YggS family)